MFGGVADNHRRPGPAPESGEPARGPAAGRESTSCGVRNFAFHEARVGAQVQEIAVGERATLGAAGRAGGVHNGREVVTTGCGTYLLQPLIAYLGGASAQGIEVTPFSMTQRCLSWHRFRSGSGVFFSLSHTIQELLILDEDGDSLRMGQRPCSLGGSVRLIYRHGDSTGIPDGEVNDGPLRSGCGS